MYLIDTNIHAAFFLQKHETDVESKKYVEFFKQIPLSQRLIPDFVLNEFEILMVQVVPSRYRLNTRDKNAVRNLTFEYIKEVVNQCKVVTPTVASVQAAAKIYLKHTNKHYISFTDSLIISTAKQLGASVFTKDERLKGRAHEEKVSTA